VPLQGADNFAGCQPQNFDKKKQFQLQYNFFNQGRREVGMPDEVIVAAEAYALHCQTCPLCYAEATVCCLEAERILRVFNEALNAMLNLRPYDA
jgi:hypothetical protein